MMKKILLAFIVLLVLSQQSFAGFSNPPDNEYDHKIPGDIRQDEAYIATGSDATMCITAAKICSSTQIPNSNIAQITSSSLVNGSSLYSLGSTPSGAGAFPITNGGTGQTSRQAALDALSAVSLSATSGMSLVSNGTDIIPGYPTSLNISSMAQGDVLFVDSTPKVNRLAASTAGYVLSTNGASSNPSYISPASVVTAGLPSQTGNTGYFLQTNGTTTSWALVNASHASAFYSTPGTYTWTAPAGVYHIWGYLQSGGGSGNADTACNGLGGGAGAFTYFDYPVTPGNSYTLIVGAGGVGVSGAHVGGNNGGATSFDSTVLAPGGNGGGGAGSCVGGAGAVSSTTTLGLVLTATGAIPIGDVFLSKAGLAGSGLNGGGYIFGSGATSYGTTATNPGTGGAGASANGTSGAGAPGEAWILY